MSELVRALGGRRGWQALLRPVTQQTKRGIWHHCQSLKAIKAVTWCRSNPPTHTHIEEEHVVNTHLQVCGSNITPSNPRTGIDRKRCLCGEDLPGSSILCQIFMHFVSVDVLN